MKRAVLVLLILSLCLALCACGEPQVIEKEVEKIVEVIPDEYEQFKDVLDALVKEEYDAAQALIEEMKPVPETPPIKEVKITTENFFDYFEFQEFPDYVHEYDIDRDSAGNITNICYYSGFYLKDGYTLAEEKLADCNVEAGVKYKLQTFYKNRGINVDLENRSYIVTGKPSGTDFFDEMRMGNKFRYSDDAPWSYRITTGIVSALSNGKDDSSDLVTDLELVSASGTLYLYE